MNDFRKSYQQMMNDMPVYSIDVDSVLNEARHKKAVARRRRQAMTSSILVLGLVCLCGFGTVKATGYFGNIIKATGTGFVTADAETMDLAMNEGVSQEACAEVEEAVEAYAAPECIEEAYAAEEPMEAEKGTDRDGVSGAEDMKLKATMIEVVEEELAIEETAVEEMVAEEIENREYSSVEAFRSAEPDAVLVLPTASVKEEVEMTNISVIGTGDTIVYHQRSADGKMVSINVSDYADSLGHVSSYVYDDDVINEREYITEAGYTYTLVDTVDEEGNYCGLHAAIAVGTYEIIVDFWGYSEEEALNMIESMDLTAYITE